MNYQHHIGHFSSGKHWSFKICKNRPKEEAMIAVKRSEPLILKEKNVTLIVELFDH